MEKKKLSMTVKENSPEQGETLSGSQVKRGEEDSLQHSSGGKYGCWLKLLETR